MSAIFGRTDYRLNNIGSYSGGNLTSGCSQMCLVNTLQINPSAPVNKDLLFVTCYSAIGSGNGIAVIDLATQTQIQFYLTTQNVIGICYNPNANVIYASVRNSSFGGQSYIHILEINTTTFNISLKTGITNIVNINQSGNCGGLAFNKYNNVLMNGYDSIASVSYYTTNNTTAAIGSGTNVSLSYKSFLGMTYDRNSRSFYVCNCDLSGANPYWSLINDTTYSVSTSSTIPELAKPTAGIYSNQNSQVIDVCVIPQLNYIVWRGGVFNQNSINNNVIYFMNITTKVVEFTSSIAGGSTFGSLAPAGIVYSPLTNSIWTLQSLTSISQFNLQLY